MRKTQLAILLLILVPSIFASAQARSSTLPIRHVVVIFQENVSFDHYFGTYPVAANPPDEPFFQARGNTPSVNGLTKDLLTNNPNLANPFRLDRSQAFTCDQNHDYTPEQLAYDGGKVDQFVQFAGNGSPGCTRTTVMGYYDGNTVTALWEYAQSFALNDNSFSTAYGPSTPGALNLISGQTHGATPANLPGFTANGTVIGDPDPTYDDCSGSTKVSMTGTNVGDLLNAAGVTWGFFQGGFTPTSTTTSGRAVCGSSHVNLNGATVRDYSAHHEPFQYYPDTSNPHHLSPSSATMIGFTDQANHQYDLSSFWAAIAAGNMPSVSYLKAAKYQDGHPGYSDPLDEQNFLVDTINKLQQTDQWGSTVVIIAYDDSDGWYDHVMPPTVSPSSDPAYDRLLGITGLCGTTGLGQYQDRCGYGPRQPLLVISPMAKRNYVDHTLTDQTSILRLIEDNWHLGRIGNQSLDAKAGTLMNMLKLHNPSEKLILDPTTGLPVKHAMQDHPSRDLQTVSHSSEN